MSDLETIRRLLDEIEVLQAELAPPEHKIFEELRLRYSETTPVTIGDDRSLEVILRNVAIRGELGLKITSDKDES